MKIYANEPVTNNQIKVERHEKKPTDGAVIMKQVQQPEENNFSNEVVTTYQVQVQQLQEGKCAIGAS
ncbi:Involucrin [Sesbania bispinosa]|nr:Involucrin [Sesbania bispinosa]